VTVGGLVGPFTSPSCHSASLLAHPPTLTTLKNFKTKFLFFRKRNNCDGRKVKRVKRSDDAFSDDLSVEVVLADFSNLTESDLLAVHQTVNEDNQPNPIEGDVSRRRRRKRKFSKIGVSLGIPHVSSLCESVAHCAVKRIMLDPSCSGSGLPTHSDNHNSRRNCKTPENDVCGGSDDGKTDDCGGSDDVGRLQKLSHFQKKLLSHALKEFKSVEVICYSTCSIHHEENEAVVEECLKTINNTTTIKIDNNDATASEMLIGSGDSDAAVVHDTSNENKVPQYCLEHPMRTWSNVGPMLRSSPETHNCRGFFLAKIVKK